MEEHNNSYPERRLTVSAVKNIMFRKPEIFVNTGPNEFGLTEWGVKPSVEISSLDRKSEILNIIKEQAPIRFGIYTICIIKDFQIGQ